jgi:glutathione synthase/RimK-type ligase-like ATP-grasp enzyme
MDSLDGFVSDDDLAIAPLAEYGWNVETVSWRGRTDWSRYDAVIIRTTWDYQDDPERFLEVLSEIEASGTILQNSRSLAEWNLDKRYLAELEANGVRIVPTIWGEEIFTARDLDTWLNAFGASEVVVKPTVSATAQDTFRLTEYDPVAAARFDGRSYMVQPFIQAIVDEGEFSVFYFNGEYSHGILKTPKPDDFRVQEEHGGIIRAVQPEPGLLKAADAISQLIGSHPLYARIDLVRDPIGGFQLMELELIEPALYLRMDPGAPSRFAAAIDRRINEL